MSMELSTCRTLASRFAKLLQAQHVAWLVSSLVASWPEQPCATLQGLQRGSFRQSFLVHLLCLLLPSSLSRLLSEQRQPSTSSAASVLTSHPSGRLRRRLIPALVGSSCWFVVSCVSPSFALACRPSPQQLSAQRRRKPELSELAVLWVVGCSSFVFVVRQHRRPSMLRRNRLTPRPSGRLRRRLTQALALKAMNFCCKFCGAERHAKWHELFQWRAPPTLTCARCQEASSFPFTWAFFVYALSLLTGFVALPLMHRYFFLGLAAFFLVAAATSIGLNAIYLRMHPTLAKSG